MIKLHNTRTGSVDEFKSIQPDKVTLYTCGPTVYSEPLLGNWVAYIRWDLLVRTLIMNGYDVRRLMNITDVGHLVSDGDEGEDKMQKGARREGTTEWEVARKYTESFLRGMDTLLLKEPEFIIKATDTIQDQIELVQTLERKGFTYVLPDGVYFDTSKFPGYAEFAHLDLEAQKAGARVAFNDGKRNPSDFVLWRLTPKNETRNMEWPSPWGNGIPGWHIECSAMALKYLGDAIDIHTGGIDHIPVHHTNEIAQSEAATGQRFANYWLHANFLLINGTKISKSLGNGYSLQDVIDKGYSPLAFKLFVLQSNYRTESNFSWENLEAAATRLSHWQQIACLRHQTSGKTTDDDAFGSLLSVRHAALEQLNNDLNSPLALSVIEKAIDDIEKADVLQLSKNELEEFIVLIDELFGLGLQDATPDIDDEIKALIIVRSRARENKDWQQSDNLRRELAERGIGLKDTAFGTQWFWL